MKEYTLKNDYLFKEVFSKKGNEYLLKDFLSEIMQENITKVEVKKDVELDKSSDMEKYGVLDLKATIDNSKIINVEMQRINVVNDKIRMYFWSLTMYIFVHSYFPFFVHSYFIINKKIQKEIIY